MAIKVYPGAANPSHHISLSDGVESWGLTLDGGEKAVQEIPLTPSTLSFKEGLSSFGDWEPGMASIEQRSWHGGRGLDTFSADDKVAATRYHNSMNAWTLTPGYLMPAPQWRMAKGLKDGLQHLPGDMNWKAVFDSQLFLASAFTIGETDLAAKEISIWLRRVGSPGDLELAVYEDDGSGDPGSVLSGADEVLTTASITDVVSVFKRFELGGVGETLYASTQYHLVVKGQQTDNATNHWEVGVDPGAQGGTVSQDGSSWQTDNYGLYFLMTEAEALRTFHFFQMKDALYAADERADGSNSHLYLNGDRGHATAGSATVLEDSDKAWGTDQWQHAWVKIVEGKGIGQTRKVIANSGIELEVSPWEVIPDSTSEYVIYGTDEWQDVSPSSGDQIDAPIRDVAVINDQAIFAFGLDHDMLYMRFNAGATPPAHEFADGASKADFLHAAPHLEDGPQLRKGRVAVSEVARSAPVSWGNPLAFGNSLKIGDQSKRLLGLFDYLGAFWALKEDGLWRISDDDQTTGYSLGLMPTGKSRVPIKIHNGDLFFGWGASVKRYSGGQVVDVGPGLDLGLPTGRGGDIRAIESLGDLLIVAIDGGEEGYSSILVWDGSGWHELFRAPEQGVRVQQMFLQGGSNMRPRLWVALTDNMAWLDLPSSSRNPLVETDQAFQHEALLEQGTIDMGAIRLPKFLKEVGLASRNLSTGVEVHLDYQLDGDIGGTSWRTAGAFYSSPLDSVAVNEGQAHAIRLRLRLLSNQAHQPPVVRSAVLDGFARTPLKYQWVLRVQLADLQQDASGGLAPDPDEFMQWLRKAAREARKIRMRSVWEALDDKYVIVEPPTLLRQFGNSLLSWWGGTANVVLREA